MKNSLYILIMICCSCATVNRSESDFIQKDNLIPAKFSETYKYNNAKLSKESLKTFEPVALEQFNEFFEQIKIATHPEYDEEFKTEAKNALKSKIMTDHIPDDIKASLDKQVGLYLERYFNEGIYSEKTNLVIMKSPFEQNGENVYKGQISFQLDGRQVVSLVNTYLVRVIKSFGNESEEIWEVRFDLF